MIQKAHVSQSCSSTGFVSPDMTRRATELQEYITALPLDADPLATVLPATHLLFRAERTFALGLKPIGDGPSLEVDFFHAAGLHAQGVANARKVLNAAYAKSSRGQVAFDARNPEPNQRNVFLDSSEIFEILRSSKLPAIIAQLMKTAEVKPERQLRTLLCDRQLLLSFVALFRDEPFSLAERRDLTNLFGSVRERMQIAQRLPRDLLAASLSVALEALGGAGFITGPTGRVLHANIAGLARLEHARVEVNALVAAAVRGQRLPGVTCTPIRAAGTRGHHLVIVRDGTHRLSEQAARAAQKWSLTPRQTQVLELLVRGLANKSIAQLLGCAEHTAENHVSAILQRVGVESRSALAALVTGL
jgi:DNA-binding CsgD family transcriptional regulator